MIINTHICICVCISNYTHSHISTHTHTHIHAWVFVSVAQQREAITPNGKSLPAQGSIIFFSKNNESFSGRFV